MSEIDLIRSLVRGTALVGAALLATLAAASPVLGQQTLVLSDGDQLSGRLKAIDAGTWTFEYRGRDVAVAAADVVSFTAPQPMGFRLADASIVAASVTPGPGGLVLQLADGSTRTVAPEDLEAAGDPADLEALRRIELGYFTPFTRFWGLSSGLGASFRSGNSQTSNFNARIDADRTTDRDRLAVTLQAAEERNEADDGSGRELTAQKFIGAVRADLFPWDRVFVFAENRYTRDRFSNIALRINLSVGSGVQLVTTDRTDVRAALGLGGRSENFTGDEPSRTVGTMNLNGQWTQEFAGFALATGLDFTPALQDFSDYQILSDTNLTTTLVAGLGFRIGVLVQYDNTPSPGIEKTDSTITTALTYTIGR